MWRVAPPDSKSKADLCGLSLQKQLHLERFRQGSPSNDSTVFSRRADTRPSSASLLILSSFPLLSAHLLFAACLTWGGGGHPFVEGMDPFPPNLIKGEFKMATTELRSCQINWDNPLSVLLEDICFIPVSKHHLFELKKASVSSYCGRPPPL